MKKILFFTFVFISLTALSQQVLHKSYQYIKNESVKYNELVTAYFYQESPIGLNVAKNLELLDRYKMYMFYNSECISETHYFPLSKFDSRFSYFKALYGDAKSSYYNGNTMYSWTNNDNLTITITKSYNSVVKEKLVQINYVYQQDLDKLQDITEKSQSSFTKIKTIKK